MSLHEHPNVLAINCQLLPHTLSDYLKLGFDILISIVIEFEQFNDETVTISAENMIDNQSMDNDEKWDAS